MNKLLIDNNIVLDLLAKREPFYESAALLFSFADKNLVELSVSSMTFANTNYILSKLKSGNEAREILRKFRILVKVLPLNEKIIDLALNDKLFSDFKDALHYYSSIENNHNFIITRNLRDYKNSKIPVMTANEFIVSYNFNTSDI